MKCLISVDMVWFFFFLMCWWVIMLVIKGKIIYNIIDRSRVFYGIVILVMFSSKLVIGVKVIIMIKLLIDICIRV